MIEVAGCNNPSANSMRPYMQRLMRTNSLGAKDIEQMTAAWAKSTKRHVQQRDKAILRVL
jgi:hypothetical protein